MPLPASGPSATASAPTLASAHQALMQTRGLQHDFAAQPGPQPPPPWLIELGRALVAAAPILKIVFWCGVALGAALLLWVIVRDLPFARRWRARRNAVGAPADWRPDGGAARALLAEADRLAQAGRFEEAIHLLLFRSIEDIAAKRPGAVRAALTSRDIVAAAPLSDAGRLAFGLITETVERHHFGGRPAGPDDFDRCRTQYQAFALAEGAR